MRSSQGSAVRATGVRVLSRPSVFHASRDCPRAASAAADFGTRPVSFRIQDLRLIQRVVFPGSWATVATQA